VYRRASSAIRNHLRLLAHQSLGVTELRTFHPPMVAYVDNEDDFVGLCLEMEGKTSGIYVGVQPRPLWLFDKAPNCWRPARSGPDRNCACDRDIEYITTVFKDIDVESIERRKGHPASEQELLQTLRAAQLLCREEGLALSSAICCSGNGHYVLASLVPIPVDSNEVALKFKHFCRQLAEKVAGRVTGVKFDPVFNLSRVMRVMGTTNRKGQPVSGRPHRRAHFVTEPVFARSMALYHMILNTDVNEPRDTSRPLPMGLRCDLRKLENCQFIQWCRAYPEHVSEPLWWAMITNLAYLEGGIQRIHEISRLDRYRYDCANTQRVIQRVIDAGYKPVSCTTILSETMTCAGQGKFQCSRINRCPAKAPIYMATLHTVYNR
jgi:hypothetical protein